MNKAGYFEWGKIIILLSLTVMFSLAVYSTSQEENTIEIRNRFLTSENVVPAREMSEGYYLVEVSQPVQEETYNNLQQKASIEGIIPPKVYIVKAGRQALKELQSEGMIKRIWRYTSEKNVDAGLSQEQETTVTIVFFPSADKEKIVQHIASYGMILNVFDNAITVKMRGSLIKEITKLEGVEWVERWAQPEISNDAATVVTGVSSERVDHAIYGQGEIIAIADTGLDRGVNDATMHNDFQGRILSITDVATCCSTGPDDDGGHGTHVSGTALGNGVLSGSIPGIKQFTNSYAGVAPEAQLVFQAIGEDFVNSTFVFPPALISGLFQPTYNQGVRIHSNSWGANSPSSFGSYTSNARDIDQFIWNNKEMNIVFAVGNWAFQGGGFKNDTIAPHAVAKNVISVGGSENYHPLIADPPAVADNINELYLGSGRGPTNDGRIKPDILAPATEVFSTRSRIAPAWPGGGCTKNMSQFGGNYNLGPNYATCGGTSMSTPHIAGMVALLREFYKNNMGIPNPSSALIKATLINSAVDMGFGLPSNATGWGRVNISRVLPSSETALFIKTGSQLSTGQQGGCGVMNVSSGAPLKVTLVWSDKEAALPATIALVNNLDLVVTDPLGNVYNGNDFTSPYNNAVDARNNVEQVIIPNPMPGMYTLMAKGTNIMFGPQPYSIVASYKSSIPGGSPVQVCTAT